MLPKPDPPVQPPSTGRGRHQSVICDKLLSALWVSFGVMINSPTVRRWAMPAAWFATVAITFCLGRLSAPNERITITESGPSAVQPGNGALSSGSTADAFSDTAGFSGNRINGAGITSAAQLAHGASLEEWLKKLFDLGDDIARMTGFMRLLEVADASELQTALAVLRETNDNWGRSREFPMLMQKWAQLDPKAAAEFMAQQTDRRVTSVGIQSVFSTWARQNPQESIAWAQEHGSTGEGSDTENWPMAVIVNEIAEQSPDWALQLAESQPRSQARGAMIGAMISGLLAQKSQAEVRDQILALNDESLRNGMLVTLVSRVARDDPAGTATWVQTLPAGEGRERAMTELINRWSDQDLAGAAAFLNQYPPSPETDGARQRLAETAVRNDPQSAIAWAGSITREDQRFEALSSVVRRWFRSDADAARAWLHNSELAPEARARLLGIRELNTILR